MNEPISRSPLRRSRSHKASVETLASDSDLIVSGSADGSATVSLVSGKQEGSLSLPTPLYRLTLPGAMIAAAEGLAYVEEIGAASISCAHNVIILGTSLGFLYAYALPSSRSIVTPLSVESSEPPSSSSVSASKCASDGPEMAAASSSERAATKSSPPSSLPLLWSVKHHHEEVGGLSIHSDPSMPLLASVDDDGCLNIVHLRTGGILAKRKGAHIPMSSFVSFQPPTSLTPAVSSGLTLGSSSSSGSSFAVEKAKARSQEADVVFLATGGYDNAVVMWSMEPQFTVVSKKKRKKKPKTKEGGGGASETREKESGEGEVEEDDDDENKSPEANEVGVSSSSPASSSSSSSSSLLLSSAASTLERASDNGTATLKDGPSMAIKPPTARQESTLPVPDMAHPWRDCLALHTNGGRLSPVVCAAHGGCRNLTSVLLRPYFRWTAGSPGASLFHFGGSPPPPLPPRPASIAPSLSRIEGRGGSLDPSSTLGRSAIGLAIAGGRVKAGTWTLVNELVCTPPPSSVSSSASSASGTVGKATTTAAASQDKKTATTAASPEKAGEEGGEGKVSDGSSEKTSANDTTLPKLKDWSPYGDEEEGGGSSRKDGKFWVAKAVPLPEAVAAQASTATTGAGVINSSSSDGSRTINPPFTLAAMWLAIPLDVPGGGAGGSSNSSSSGTSSSGRAGAVHSGEEGYASVLLIALGDGSVVLLDARSGLRLASWWAHYSAIMTIGPAASAGVSTPSASGPLSSTPSSPSSMSQHSIFTVGNDTRVCIWSLEIGLRGAHFQSLSLSHPDGSGSGPAAPTAGKREEGGARDIASILAAAAAEETEAKTPQASFSLSRRPNAVVWCDKAGAFIIGYNSGYIEVVFR